jgi:DinB superfamily
MREVINDVRIVIGRELGAFQREIELFPDDDLVWKTVPGVVNSAGNLALHVCGNLQYFVGAQLGETGFVRNRELEFSRRSGTRAELVAGLRQTADVVDATLARLSDDTFLRAMPEAKRGMVFEAHTFLIHLCAHTAFHLGQAGYLRRALSGDPTSSGPMSLDELHAAVNES